MSELTEHEKRTMSINRAISILQDRDDHNNCDGSCDLEPPYKKCSGCMAAGTLNSIWDILREAL